MLSDIDQKLLIDKLQAHSVLRKSWSGESIADYLQVSSNKERVNPRIEILKDEDIRDKMRRLCESDRFPFTYDGMDDEDPNPGHEIDDFMAGQTVAVEFQVHFRNFRTPKRPEGAVDYSFRLQSIYLVRDPLPEMSTPRKRRRDLDDSMLITSPRTKSSRVS